MLDTAMGITGGPTAIRWSKTAAPRASIDEVGSGLSARRIREGSEVCLIGIGKMLASAAEAADLLEAEGVSCSVWDPRVVKPLDPVMISHASQHGLVVTAEDGLRAGGIGQAIHQKVSKSGSTPVVSVGIPTTHLPHGKVEELLARYRLDARGIASVVREHLKSSPVP